MTEEFWEVERIKSKAESTILSYVYQQDDITHNMLINEILNTINRAYELGKQEEINRARARSGYRHGRLWTNMGRT